MINSGKEAPTISSMVSTQMSIFLATVVWDSGSSNTVVDEVILPRFFLELELVELMSTSYSSKRVSFELVSSILTPRPLLLFLFFFDDDLW